VPGDAAALARKVAEVVRKQAAAGVDVFMHLYARQAQ